jgi:hypothetical protein
VLDESDNLSDVDDDEIEAAILNADEVEIRTQLWTELNREYLEQQEGVRAIRSYVLIHWPRRARVSASALFTFEVELQDMKMRTGGEGESCYCAAALGILIFPARCSLCVPAILLSALRKKAAGGGERCHGDHDPEAQAAKESQHRRQEGTRHCSTGSLSAQWTCG